MSSSPAFTSEQIADDARNRVARTAGQVSIPAALVVIGEWVAQQAGWSSQLPADVAAAVVAVLTGVAAYVTNRSRIHGA